jgi:hypothetical protein
MIAALAFLTFLVLVVFLGAHATLLVSLVTRKPRYRAAVALAVPPLAPFWGWQIGFRGRVYVWGAALVVYAIGVAILAR